MKVLEYLNSFCERGIWYEQALGQLTSEYGIKVTSNDKYPKLVCLNYDQINSPKYDDITRECRSLVLEIPEYDFGVSMPTMEKEFTVVSRSFDRFFNEGEEQGVDYDITKMTAYEKVDGSIVSLFYYKGEWLYRTRGMIMPDGELKINGTNLSWKDLIEESLGDVSEFFLENITYIFEVVSPENRVVTRYSESCAYLLSVRNNVSGEYSNYSDDYFFLNYIYSYNIRTPKSYVFNTIECCIKAAKELRELNEGYVLYDESGVPRIKVKNPAYVAAHHLRGEGVLSNRRIMDLIIMNEQDEYLSIFPEDKERFKPYMNSVENCKTEYQILWDSSKDITDQKEFALQVKDYPVCGLLFSKKKNKDLTFTELFDKLTTNSKYNLLENYLEK